MEEQTTSNHRVRINAAQDAKGFFKIEATAEFDTVEEAAAKVTEALTAATASITTAGFNRHRRSMTTAELNDQAWNAHPWTYRNNRGCANTERGFIRYGIPEPKGKNEPDDAMKGGDRIGFTEVIITPDMVGSTLAVFTSIEVKGAGDTLKSGQKKWHNFVLSHGGISEVWNNGEIIKEAFDIDS